MMSVNFVHSILMHSILMHSILSIVSLTTMLMNKLSPEEE